MENATTYLIIITKNANGYTAVAPAFPDLAVTARGSRSAHSRVKELIQTRLGQLFASNKPIPRDPVVQTRTLRFDLRKLREQEELR